MRSQNGRYLVEHGKDLMRHIGPEVLSDTSTLSVCLAGNMRFRHTLWKVEAARGPGRIKILGIPIHALSLGGERLTSTLVHQHFRTKRIPPDGIVDTPFGVSVTSPLFTLLMLAGKLDPIELALLIYEFAGTFTSSAMDPRLAREIECSVSKDQLNGLDEWQVVDTGSKETQRPMEPTSPHGSRQHHGVSRT